MSEALLTSEINEIMYNCKSASPYFKGTFPSDADIRLKFNEKSAFVMNIDNSALPGSHWVCVFVDQNSNFYYLDSINTVIPQIILELSKPFKNKYFLRKKLQPADSELCGQYCILFIHELASGTSFRKIEKIFRYRSCKQNDNFVRNWTKNHKNVCLNNGRVSSRAHSCSIQ